MWVPKTEKLSSFVNFVLQRASLPAKFQLTSCLKHKGRALPRDGLTVKDQGLEQNDTVVLSHTQLLGGSSGKVGSGGRADSLNKTTAAQLLSQI